MGVMLRRGVPVAPRISAAFGALAAAGLGNLGVCLFHPHSSSLILLFWHCGTVLVCAVLAGIAGTQLLRWPPHARALFSSQDRDFVVPISRPTWSSASTGVAVRSPPPRRNPVTRSSIWDQELVSTANAAARGRGRGN